MEHEAKIEERFESSAEKLAERKAHIKQQSSAILNFNIQD
jgi:hypothetical protein